ncbi:MAG: putative T7SS-secreted protein [Pseudonocardiales bacterium]
MAAELGQTSDPQALVPGDPGAVHKTQLQMTDYGDLLHVAGEGLVRVDTEAGWSGPAGDQFRSKFHGKPAKWTQAGQAFHGAAAALSTYAEKLTWVQHEAAGAITLWNQGEADTAAAISQHDQAVQKAQQDAAVKTTAGTPTTPASIPFVDAGEAKRQAARDKLNHARAELQTAGDAAEKVVGAGRDEAPEKPGFWDEVGDFFSSAGNTLEHLGGDVVNVLASYGQAMLNDPAALAETLAGGTLMVLGAGGEVGGVALDLTGVGALVGVPVNVLSAGVIASGAGLAGAGILQMARDAADNPVEAVQTGGGSGGGYSGGGVGGSSDPAGDLKFARKIKLDVDNPAIANRQMTVQDFIGKFRNAEVNRVFPGEYKGQTVEDALRSGDSTVRKLLTDGRWKSK